MDQQSVRSKEGGSQNQFGDVCYAEIVLSNVGGGEGNSEAAASESLDNRSVRGDKVSRTGK